MEFNDFCLMGGKSPKSSDIFREPSLYFVLWGHHHQERGEFFCLFHGFSVFSEYYSPVLFDCLFYFCLPLLSFLHKIHISQHISQLFAENSQISQNLISHKIHPKHQQTFQHFCHKHRMLIYSNQDTDHILDCCHNVTMR